MLVAGPLVGSLLLLVTNAPLVLLDVVAGIIYAVTMPFVALTTAYVYFDTRVRDELAAPIGPTSCRPRSGWERPRYRPACAVSRPFSTAAANVS